MLSVIQILAITLCSLAAGIDLATGQSWSAALMLVLSLINGNMIIKRLAKLDQLEGVNNGQ